MERWNDLSHRKRALSTGLLKSIPVKADASPSFPRASVDGSGSGGAPVRRGRRGTRASQRIRKAGTSLMADYLPGPDADYQAWVTVQAFRVGLPSDL